MLLAGCGFASGGRSAAAEKRLRHLRHAEQAGEGERAVRAGVGGGPGSRSQLDAAAHGGGGRAGVGGPQLDPPPESPRNRWRSSHEHVLFLAKQSGNYVFNADCIRVPYADATIKRWYQKKCAASLSVVALKAVAHKLARACYYVMKDGRGFDVAKAFG